MGQRVSMQDKQIAELVLLIADFPECKIINLRKEIARKIPSADSVAINCLFRMVRNLQTKRKAGGMNRPTNQTS